MKHMFIYLSFKYNVGKTQNAQNEFIKIFSKNKKKYNKLKNILKYFFIRFKMIREIWC